MGKILKLEKEQYEKMPKWYKPKYHYMLIHENYLDGKYNPDEYKACFEQDLDCFEMDEIITKYNRPNNPNQELLIKWCNRQAPYTETRMYNNFYSDFSEKTYTETLGRRLLHLIEQKLKYQELQKSNYILNSCLLIINSFLENIQVHINKTWDMINSYLTGEYAIKRISVPDAIWAYLIYDEKRAFEFFKISGIAQNEQLTLSFKTLIGEYQIGNPLFLPSIRNSEFTKI